MLKEGIRQDENLLEEKSSAELNDSEMDVNKLRARRTRWARTWWTSLWCFTAFAQTPQRTRRTNPQILGPRLKVENHRWILEVGYFREFPKADSDTCLLTNRSRLHVNPKHAGIPCESLYIDTNSSRAATLLNSPAEFEEGAYLI